MYPKIDSRIAPGPPTVLKKVSAWPCGDEGGFVVLEVALRDEGVLSACGRALPLPVETPGIALLGGGAFDVEAAPGGGAGAPPGPVAVGCSTKANLQTGQVPLVLSQVVIQSSWKECAHGKVRATPEPADVFSSGRGADCISLAALGSNGAKYSVQMAQDCPAFTRSQS